MRRIFLIAMLIAGCERENPGPPDAGPRPDSGREDGGRDDGGIDAGDFDGGDVDAGTDAGQVDAGPGCEDEGCWACEPTTTEQLLNACTDSSCAAFPITRARLPRLNEDGTLPPLD
jgi:hypothetical protein